ncbi:MAG: hypothetical protein II949_09475 [Prevotella sp.]|nr:hypothetical protein [Prevotella sp.]
MTAIQLNTMNTELWQSIGAIADNESLMRRLTRYAKKLAKEKEDSTLMTKEEFFAKIERAEQQSARGEGMAMLPGEDLATFLKRNGYEI